MEAIWTSKTIIRAYYLKFSVTNCDNPKGHSSPYFMNKTVWGKKCLHPDRNILCPEIQSASKRSWLGERELNAEFITRWCYRD